ncbi:ankyrin repeat-containing domain protein [Baffinella frigidus]|nr:ankyrin repeat-containing domain protein [Cryptophyta sp. CCMP2293]
MEHTIPIGDMYVEMTPLCIAVQLHNIPMVHLLLENGANVDGCATEESWDDYTNRDRQWPCLRQTPLATAVQNGDTDMVFLLLEKGADVNNNQSSFGMTAIWFVSVHHATLFPGSNLDIHGLPPSDLDMIRLLAERGADLNIRMEQFEREEYMLVDVNTDTIAGRSLLVCAIDDGRQKFSTNVRLIELLVELGADIQARDDQGRSVLNVAMMMGNDVEQAIMAIQLLAKLGADVNARNIHGQSALHEAVIWDWPWSDHDSGRSFRRMVIQSLAGLRRTLIDIKDKKGLTPLHYASIRDGYTEAEALIVFRANVNFKDKEGRSPLHYAVKHSSFNVVSLLIEAGANMDIKDVRGRTPLHYAAEFTDVNTVHVSDKSSGVPNEIITRKLIESGANVFAEDDRGQIPAEMEMNSTGSACGIIRSEQNRIRAVQFHAFVMSQSGRSDEKSAASWLEPDTLREVYKYL